MKNNAIKGITLILFVGLISFFVAFQSGCLWGAKKGVTTNSNDDFPKHVTDSLSKQNVIKKKTIMSSSKSFHGGGFRTIEIDTIVKDTIFKK